MVETPMAYMATTADGNVRRILIVDDDEAIGSLLASLFQDAGYAPYVVASPGDLHRIAQDDGQADDKNGCSAGTRNGAYDIVIADYLAPSFNPSAPWPQIDVLRRLSGGGPIVGCTAHQDALSGEPASLGVSAIVVKPFDLDDVLRTVEALLTPGANAVN